MTRKILPLLLLSFFIIKAYSQSVASKETHGERSISKQPTSFDAGDQLVSGIGADSGICDTPAGLSALNIFNMGATLRWEPAAGATKYKLQYKESTSSSWTSISNVIAASYDLTGLTPSTKYKFKVRSICGPGTNSLYSTVATFRTAPINTYCPTLGGTFAEYINGVQLGAINNTSGNDDGYGDYRALITSLPAGATENIKLTPGFTGDVYQENWTVYVDYNHDGDFTDGDELAGQGISLDTDSINIPITVPLTALNGKTGMRIIMHFHTYVYNPCGIFNDGEAEDYTVKITGGTLNAVAAESNVKPALNNIMVAPNPVKGSSTNVVLQAAKAGAVNIKIADLSGRILRSETISSIMAGKNTYPLRNINLLPGTYMIIAQQGNAIIARTQFVVDK